MVVVGGERYCSKVANWYKGNILVCSRGKAADTEGLLQFSHRNKREKKVKVRYKQLVDLVIGI